MVLKREKKKLMNCLQKRKIEGKSLVLQELHIDFINKYLQALSPTVCKILAIKTVEHCHTFFLCIFEEITQLLIGAIEIRSKVYRSQLYNWINEAFWGNGY